MRTRRDEFDVRVGFSFMDSDYCWSIPGDVRWFYMLLRRNVWRGKHWNKEIDDMVKSGQLVSYLSQDEAAEKMHCSVRTIGSWTASLRQLGWIETTQIQGRAMAYILGRRVVAEGAGRSHQFEVFFADSVVEQEVTAELERKQTSEASFRAPRQPASEVVGSQLPGSDQAQECDSEGESGQKSDGEVDKRSREAVENKPSAANAACQDRDPGVREDQAGIPEGMERRESMDEVLARARAKNQAAIEERIRKGAQPRAEAERRVPKGRSKHEGDEGQVTALTVETWFSAALRARWPELVVARWAVKELAMAKQLLFEYGPALVEQAVVHLVSNWDDIAKRLKLTGMPSIRLLNGYRDTLFGEVQVGVERPGEYNKSAAERSPAVGWGGLAKRAGD